MYTREFVDFLDLYDGVPECAENMHNVHNFHTKNEEHVHVTESSSVASPNSTYTGISSLVTSEGSSLTPIGNSGSSSSIFVGDSIPLNLL